MITKPCRQPTPSTRTASGAAAVRPPTLPTVWVRPDTVANSSERNHEESFLVRHVYLLGANDLYGALETTLKAEIDEAAWATLYSNTSRAFDKP